jgi:hypothetical protein
MSLDLTISTEAGSKGRSFKGSLLASIDADRLWEGGNGADPMLRRPVYAVVGSSEQQSKTLLANLRTGRKAELGVVESHRKAPLRMELLRSAGYRFVQQRCPSGVVIVAYLPDLFEIDPGMVDPKQITFVLAPSREWVSQDAMSPAVVADAVAHGLSLGVDVCENWRDDDAPAIEARLADWARLAPLFAAYIDRRTRAPLIPSVAFQLQLFVACLDKGFATLSTPPHTSRFKRDAPFGMNVAMGYREHDVEEIGHLPGVAFRATHEDFEPFLAEQAALYVKTGRKI